MNIKYTLTTNDYFNFQKRYASTKGILFKNWIFLITSAWALFNANNKYVFNFLIINGNKKIPEDIFGGSFNLIFLYNLLLLTAAVFLIRYIIILSYKRHYNRSTYLNGPREIIITDDRLIIKRVEVSIDYKMNYLYSLNKVKDYYYLTFCDQVKILIPENTSGVDEFLRILKEKTNVC